MNKIALNDATDIDLSKLIDTRLLIQANSGGGKSWAIRRLLEQSHGKVQQIVIDLEGEFSTLREKYDYILAGKEGETPSDPRSAALLAKRLLELNVSAIIDLYELNHQDRKRFVRLFLTAMVNAPKALWHPVIVVIDEAHVFAPQTGSSEAMEAVIDLATRGRKRGYCAVLATQRISKLHKDAVAEMNNKLIGRTGLDIDRKRAAEELGFTSKEDALSLRNLAPGSFYAFGPAISDEVIEVEIGAIQTSHPKAGNRIITQTTPPTAKIKSLLGKLADLPQEAREETETMDSLKSEVTMLRRKVTVLEKNKPVIQPSPAVKTITETSIVHEQAIGKIAAIINKLPKPGGGTIIVQSTPAGPNPFYEDKPITGGAKRMLEVLATRYPMTFSKSQLALMAKMSPRSGSYGTYLSRLRSADYLVESDGQIGISDAGLEFIGITPTEPQSQEEILAMWSANLNGGARRMFDYLIQEYPRFVSRQELGDAVEMSARSGSFGTYLSRLKSNGLIKVQDTNIKASDDLFVEGKK